jgi:hypothetical protein
MYQYLTIGYDCSPASALRSLNLREFALPFDWVVSNINSIEMCFNDNFSKFHKDLKLSETRKRLIDAYGFQFPHDYPFDNVQSKIDNDIGEGVFDENISDLTKPIVSNWMDYYFFVKEKYNRRIERFLNIVKSDEPIIVLCRYSIQDVIKLQQLFIKYYNNDRIIFINSCNQYFVNDQIINCYTEKNGLWNDSSLWKEAIDYAIEKIKKVKSLQKQDIDVNIKGQKRHRISMRFL